MIINSFSKRNDHKFDVLNLVLWVQVGPKGLEFARYSLDYHTIRNYLNVVRKWGKERFVEN